jgi:putative ABC transport system permease protein
MLRRKLRRDLRRQRAQFAAVALTVMLGAALFGATYEAYRSLRVSYDTAFVRYRFANLTITGGRLAPIARRARATPGVAAVQARVQADLPMTIGAHKLVGRVVGVPAGRQPSVNRVELREGTYPSAARPGGVLVEEHTAEHFRLAPGDGLTVGGRRARVVGVAASPEYFWPAKSRQEVLVPADDFAVVFAPERLAERFSRSAPNQLAIYFADGKPNAALAPALTRLAYAAGAQSATTRADQPSNNALQQDVKGFGALAIMFPVLFLLAGGLASSVVLTRMVAAQRPIIGTLRAAGFPRGAIVRHYLGFGVVPGLGGGALGALLGVALAGRLTHVYTSELSIPVAVTRLSPWTPLVGAGSGLLAGLLAAAAPARAAARIPPAEAMRGIAPTHGGRRTIGERLVPPLRRLPARWKLVLRGVERDPRRTLSTVSGVVLALTLVLVSWGMIDTVQVLANRQFTKVQRQDAELAFAGPVSAARLAQVRGAPGVGRVEPAARVPVVLSRGGVRYDTELLAFEPGTRMHEFRVDGGGTTRVPSTGILVGAALREQLHLRAGERVTLAAGGGRMSLRVLAFLDEPLGTYAYASLRTLRTLGAGANRALVRYRPGVERTRERRLLAALPGVAAVADSRALLDTFNRYLGLFYAFIGIMLIFGSAMAFALLYNAMTSNIAERSVELATLRAAGIARAELARLITAENALVVAAGIVPGLLVGYELARIFMASYSTNWYSFDLAMRPTTPVFAALAILVVALVSQHPSLRATRRLDVGRVMRERSL